MGSRRRVGLRGGLAASLVIGTLLTGSALAADPGKPAGDLPTTTAPAPDEVYSRIQDEAAALGALGVYVDPDGTRVIVMPADGALPPASRFEAAGIAVRVERGSTTAATLERV